MTSVWSQVTGDSQPTLQPVPLPSLPQGLVPRVATPAQQEQVQPQVANQPDWSMFSSLVRYNAVQAYDDYLRSYQTAVRASAQPGQRLIDINVGADLPQPLSPQDWINQAVDSEMQQVNLVDYLDLAYQRSNGHSMPEGERQAVLSAIHGADANTKMQLLTQMKAMAGDQASLMSLGYLVPKYDSSGNPKPITASDIALAQSDAALGFSPTNPTLTNPTFQFITSVMNQYELMNPTAMDVQQSLANAAAKRVDAYTTTFGHAPDAATQQHLQSMSDLEWQSWLSNTKTYFDATGTMPDAATQQRLSTMSTSQASLWAKNVQTLSQAWYDNFGKMPSAQQMMAAGTMNADQLTEYINNSPSRVTGLNIGQFDGYKAALDPVYKKEFGHAAPDELVQYFNEAQQAG